MERPRSRRRLSDEAATFVAALRHPREPARPADVLRELRRVIIAGDAPPGLVIPPEEVGAAFGVSVIPVREALKTLVGEGLVEHRPRGGYTVASLTMAELRELYLVRGVLEQAALASAVKQATLEDHALAQAAHEALAAALRENNDHGLHQWSRRFHLAIVAPSGMRRLQGLLESAWNLTEPYRPMSLVPAPERAEFHAEHEQMLRAFVAGDTAALLHCAADHHDHLRRVIGSLPDPPRAVGTSTPGPD